MFLDDHVSSGLTHDWRGSGNDPGVDENIWRQRLSACDYAEFVCESEAKVSERVVCLLGPRRGCRWLCKRPRGFRVTAPSLSRSRSSSAAKGTFYGCGGGAEARRINRPPIDVGPINDH